MAFQVFCNVCLCEPHKPTPRFSLTSCGHVICEICLQKGNGSWWPSPLCQQKKFSSIRRTGGDVVNLLCIVCKKDECLICRTPCRTLFLSKQVAEFQEKHRKHLLAYHRQKTMKLEESLKEVTQQLHQMQCMKPPEQTPQLPFSSTSRNPHSIPSRKQNGYSSYSLHPSHPSTSEITTSIDITYGLVCVIHLILKDTYWSHSCFSALAIKGISEDQPDTPTGPTRLSLITPPRDGRMGSVSYRSSQSSGIMSSQNSRAGST
ncbi:Rnf212, partial [Columba guinea]